MNDDIQSPTSPAWGPTTKLVVGLTIVAIIAALLVTFRSIIGPLILAFILAYLLHPLSDRLSRLLHISWRFSVNLIYLLLVILLGGLFAVSILELIRQTQSLINLIQRFIEDLPQLAASLSELVFRIGPFEFPLSQIDFQTITDQVLAAVQPLVGRIGSLVSTFAASTAVTVGWGLFVILVSYFILADAGRVPNQMVQVNLPGYNADIRRLSSELRDIWDAFLRGQLIITIMVLITYAVLMTILGMRFVLAIAILAGLARFVPYIGPLITWIVIGLVALFQGGNYFGLAAWQYMLLVIGLALLVDQIFDNIVVPRIMGHTLGVHPAAVLVAAIIAANLLGIIGLVLAAPVLATLTLAGRYILRKMFDLDPWPEEDRGIGGEQDQGPPPWRQSRQRLKEWWKLVQSNRK